MRIRRWGIEVLCLAVFAATAAAAPPREGRGVDFDRDIRPILSDACFHCHGPDADQRKAGLRLDTREGAFADLGGYRAIVPGEPGASELYRRISSHDSDEKMPPPDSGRSVTPAQADLLRKWIEGGAPWAQHWSLVPARREALPSVSDRAWPRNAIDRFVLARLDAERLGPSPEAARRTLIRRVTLDLTGLAPNVAEVEAFVEDSSPNAYEKLVDRLLDSPRFGERWTWVWLDAARYADSNGYQGDGERTMWPWRDWVVQALNRNMPYDRFTVWQIAGDLLPEATVEQKLATGFCRNHMINGEGGRIPEENRVEYIFDQVETVGTVWLGLTFNCTRCHDHKYDPLTRDDYYGLFAFFNRTPVDGSGGNPQTPPTIELPSDAQVARVAELARSTTAAELEQIERSLFPREAGQQAVASAAAAELPDPVKAALGAAPAARNAKQLADLAAHFAKSNAHYAAAVNQLRAVVEERQAIARAIPRVMVMQDMAEPRKTFILDKGLYNQPGEEVFAAAPAVLPPMPSDAPVNRLGLARWLVSPEHPLTARVAVNQFWQQFFGVGLVKTAEDFGSQGERPSHPQLLDWLATELVRTGWDIKQLCRLIVTSATYRQSSAATPQLIERDPENRLLARGARFRLPSWMLRDQALAAGGLLVGDIGGPPVNPYQPQGIWEEATFGTKKYTQDTGAALYRRSLYTFWRRIAAPTVFFDAASRQVCTIKQVRTNTPLHALTTLNDVTFVEAARAMAQRVLTSGAESDGQRLALAFRLVLARPPADNEGAVLLATMDRLRAQYAADPSAAQALVTFGESSRDPRLDPIEHAAFTGLCLAILNLDESLTKE